MLKLNKQNPNDFVVFSTDKKHKGTVISQRPCQLAGCRGVCLGVRWEDKKLTWPCTKGMEHRDDGWHIL